jgi:hypothetical protein
VLVENNLFILFGYNKGNNLTNSVLILDISNPSNLTFKSSWLTVLKNEDITTSNSTSNKGVIIGAAVGGSIGVSYPLYYETKFIEMDELGHLDLGCYFILHHEKKETRTN